MAKANCESNCTFSTILGRYRRSMFLPSILSPYFGFGRKIEGRKIGAPMFLTQFSRYSKFIMRLPKLDWSLAAWFTRGA
jgi:hypothetical protein